jgi:pimeloyl-ACP methyl ester carboxylesterase
VTSTPECTEFRFVAGNQAALVFIHGGGGDPVLTWGKFPQYLAADARANGWDIYSYGYVSTGPNKVTDLGVVKLFKYLMRITGDPDVPSLADGLSTALGLQPLGRYAALAIVAHSLGGVISQRMLVDHHDLAQRIRFLFLFGAPSNGFEGWGLGSMMSQLASIRPESPLIRDLRARWQVLYVDKPAPFEYWAVAGDQDLFVPRESSLGPFPEERRRVVPGDHESMKDPADPRNRAVQLVLEGLAGKTLYADRWGSARAAVELGQYHEAIGRLEPHAAELDEDGVVTLALALESVGRSEEALRTLEKAKPEGTDAMGVLGGRLKRRWQLYRSRDDGEKALRYYSDGYQLARTKARYGQACYLGINVAFMQLAYLKDATAASETAKAVLDLCRSRPPNNHWRWATEGEANLYLEQPQVALECYKRALASNTLTLRQMQSIYQQARQAAALLPDESTLSRLDALFLG